MNKLHDDDYIRDILRNLRLCYTCDNFYNDMQKFRTKKMCTACYNAKVKEYCRKKRSNERLARGMERATSINQTL